MIWFSSLSGTTVWHTAIIVRNSQIWGDVGWTQTHTTDWMRFLIRYFNSLLGRISLLQAKKWEKNHLRGSSRCFGWERGRQTLWSYCCWMADCCKTRKNHLWLSLVKFFKTSVIHVAFLANKIFSLYSSWSTQRIPFFNSFFSLFQFW